MDLFVLLAVIVTVIGLIFAVYGRYRRSTGGLTDKPDHRSDHPGDDGHDAFEVIADDRGKR